jgi:hypothetical protein
MNAFVFPGGYIVVYTGWRTRCVARVRLGACVCVCAWQTRLHVVSVRGGFAAPASPVTPPRTTPACAAVGTHALTRTRCHAATQHTTVV